MPRLNLPARELVSKLVYWGPAQSGKSEHLAWLSAHAPGAQRGRLVQLAAQTEHALLFEFLPLALGAVGPLATRWHAYTVPGQPGFASVRRAVVRGADGVVFVADARPGRLADNASALAELRDAVPLTLPTVLAVNHVDAPQATAPTALAEALGWRLGPPIAACAVRGEGVALALRTLARAVLAGYAQTVAEPTG